MFIIENGEVYVISRYIVKKLYVAKKDRITYNSDWREY